MGGTVHMLHALGDLRLIELPLFASDTGDLVVMEGGAEVPMDIARVFTIKVRDGVRRGRHAHKRCTQMVSCLNGAVDVTCEDGVDKRTVRLDRADRGLFIPPSIWVEICWLPRILSSRCCATVRMRRLIIFATTQRSCPIATPLHKGEHYRP